MSDYGHREAALSNDSDGTGFLEESIESSGAVHLGALRELETICSFCS